MALTRLRLDELVNAWVSDGNTPFQIALLGIFDAGPFGRPDGGVDCDRICHELALRARTVLPLRRRVVWTRPGEGRPVWVEDPAFDPRRHIEHVPLPPGAELPTWAANRIVQPLPPERPLWRVEVVDGVEAGRFAVIVVLHHVVADGLTGVAIAASLLDTRPDVAPGIAPDVAVDPLPSSIDLVLDRLRASVARLRQARPLSRDRRERLRRGVRQFSEASADFRTRTARTSLPGQVGARRRLAVVAQPLAELKATGHRLGVTLNDLVLAAVASGLRDLLDARGDPVDGMVLRASVPAATGRPGQVDGIMVVDLPVGEPDAERRLALIHGITATAKSRLRAGGGDVTDVLHLPVPVAHLGIRWMRRFGGSRVNLFVTNVPGPPVPLWLAGARLLQAVPVAPLVAHVPLGIAVLSYAGELVVAVNADGSMADLDVLAEGIHRGFEELRAGEGLPSPLSPHLVHAPHVVECAVDVSRPTQEVFAYCVDPRHEPEWNPYLHEVQPLTEGPIGVGSRYRMRFGSGAGDSLVRYVGFEPGRAWSTVGTSRRLDVRFEGEVLPHGAGTRVLMRTELRPRGALRPLAPALRRVFRRRFTDEMATLRRVLEDAADATGDVVTAPPAAGGAGRTEHARSGR